MVYAARNGVVGNKSCTFFQVLGQCLDSEPSCSTFHLHDSAIEFFVYVNHNQGSDGTRVRNVVATDIIPLRTFRHHDGTKVEWSVAEHDCAAGSSWTFTRVA